MKIGDIVQLKSGSPKMTVTGMYIKTYSEKTEQIIKTVYYMDGVMCHNEFPENALEYNNDTNSYFKDKDGKVWDGMSTYKDFKEIKIE